MTTKTRSITKREEVLIALRNAGVKGITNADLSKIALRYGGYLGKLYELGYDIRKESLGNGLFNYVLVSEPEEFTEKESASSRLLNAVQEKGLVSYSELESILSSLGISVRYKAGTHQVQMAKG